MHWHIDENFWKPIIDHARDVLKIDLFIIGQNSNPIYMSNCGNRYGRKFEDSLLNVHKNFSRFGNYRWERIDKYKFSYFAIELINSDNKCEGYVVIGPVILNKRLNLAVYEAILSKTGENYNEFLERLEEIRVITQLNMDSILLTIEALIYPTSLKNQTQADNQNEEIPEKSLLNSMFKLVLNMTEAQSGSVMIYDKNTKKLDIHSSKGIELEKTSSGSISNIAFKEGRALIIKGASGIDNPEVYLKRLEIKESIVMPFKSPQGTIKGVLNINYLNSKQRDLQRINQRIEHLISNVLENL